MCFKNSTFLKPDLIFFRHLLHEAAYHELPGTPAGMALTRNHTTHHFHFLGLLHVAYIQCSPVGLLFLFPSMIWPHVSEEIKNKGPLYWLCHLHIWTLWLWFHEPTKMRRRQPLCSQTSELLWLCLPLPVLVCMHYSLDCSSPGSSVHGILQARILEWVTIPFSRGSSQPRTWTQVSVFCIAGRFFTHLAIREASCQPLLYPNKRGGHSPFFFIIYPL